MSQKLFLVEVIAINTISKEKKKTQINNITLNFEEPEKDKLGPKLAEGWELTKTYESIKFLK